MNSYHCNYTWEDIKEATNNCLRLIYETEDGVADIFRNGLPQAMDRVAKYVFVNGDSLFNNSDIILIRLAYKQLNKVGFIGHKE